ncbi:hypothetical protein MUK42_34897 [Musa troglodytarum]|uniref:Uncharacterized protein n=1 Tax=Musa troglodytarum TaxID=320322 RepID=A0A9E7E9D9_9LILI|nr:hypothetical protein MUK42_34897 [Musa troglodytarum]
MKFRASSGSFHYRLLEPSILVLITAKTVVCHSVASAKPFRSFLDRPGERERRWELRTNSNCGTWSIAKRPRVVSLLASEIRNLETEVISFFFHRG